MLNLRYIDTLGLTIEQVFKRVRVAVEDMTGGRQTPWETSSLRGDFYFKPVEKGEAPTAIMPAALDVEKTPSLVRKSQAVSPAARKLTIFTNPADSQVKILNSSRGFHNGIRLEPGDYHIMVSKEGYIPRKQWINIDKEDRQILITLVPED